MVNCNYIFDLTVGVIFLMSLEKQRPVEDGYDSPKREWKQDCLLAENSFSLKNTFFYILKTNSQIWSANFTYMCAGQKRKQKGRVISCWAECRVKVFGEQWVFLHFYKYVWKHYRRRKRSRPE